MGAGGVALGKGSGRCERQVGLSSASLLASATRVSHGMRWHQIFNEHAAKKEEGYPELVQCCAQVRGKKKFKIGYFQLQVEQIVCLTFIFLLPAKNKKVHPCSFKMAKVREDEKASETR